MSSQPVEPQFLDVDDDLVVIDKPAGWLVHPAGTTDPDVLAWLARAMPDTLRPVHRLDKETSGLVVFARRADVAGVMGTALAGGRLHKVYEAVVLGKMEGEGVIDTPLSDSRRGRELEARTQYKVLEVIGNFTWLSLSPITGRKHQLRKHLQGIGHPIVGDTRYPPPTFVRVPAFPRRLWLHARSITMPDGRVLDCPLPAQLQEHLQALRDLAPPKA